MMMLTKALRKASLSFLGAYDVAAFLPFVPGGGLGGDGDALPPFAVSQVLLRRCFGFLPKPITTIKGNYCQITLLLIASTMHFHM